MCRDRSAENIAQVLARGGREELRVGHVEPDDQPEPVGQLEVELVGDFDVAPQRIEAHRLGVSEPLLQKRLGRGGGNRARDTNPGRAPRTCRRAGRSRTAGRRAIRKGGSRRSSRSRPRSLRLIAATRRHRRGWGPRATRARRRRPEGAARRPSNSRRTLALRRSRRRASVRCGRWPAARPKAPPSRSRHAIAGRSKPRPRRPSGGADFAPRAGRASRRRRECHTSPAWRRATWPKALR